MQYNLENILCLENIYCVHIFNAINDFHHDRIQYTEENYQYGKIMVRLIAHLCLEEMNCVSYQLL